jgi:hypothetical protein
VGITLSKPTPHTTLKNIFVKPITTKKGLLWSFTMRYATADQVQNFEATQAIAILEKHFETDFFIANVFCQDADYQFIKNKKKATHSIKTKPTHTQITTAHDRKKNYVVQPTAPYLYLLGIANASGQVLKDKQDKYRQINKYVEIMANLVQNTALPPVFTLVDMGAGKGYLTFALYDHLRNVLGLQVQIIGVEMRENLVDFCNELAQKMHFEQLSFVANTVEKYIENFDKKPDILVALHACDTATDDAIHAGIAAQATLIVCAPCCHKQVRQSMRAHPAAAHPLHPLLRHGIVQERQAELLTDTIRALILEENGYKTNIFEFVQTEHTAKNLLITAQHTAQKNADAPHQIQHLKNTFGIETHYLQEIMALKK